MKFKKIILLTLPVIALSAGIAALNTSRSDECSVVYAADYTPSNRKLTFNNDGSVKGTFSVNDNVLDTKGWLLCLFTSKPAFNPTDHKTEGSDRLHPYSTSECAHYFFASNETKEGNISVTWSANSADQKESWSKTESEGVAGHTLHDYLSLSTDWYIVIGIRHWNNSWAVHGSNPGEGTDGQGERGWWENADYYAGRESNIRNDLPYGEIYLDLTDCSGWANDNAKFAFYFFDENGHNAFSDFAASVPLQDDIYIASYELDFTPTKMNGIRLNSTCTTPSWDYKWNQTQDLDFYQYGVIGVKGFENDGWSDALATVKITRNSDEIEVILDNYKRNKGGKSEHYNDYIDLQEDDEFVISYGSNSYHNWDCLSIFDDNFSYDSETSKIKVEVTGTYSFYFKAYENQEVHHDVFISKPEVAFADAWAQAFLEGNCQNTKDNWSTYADDFDDLPHSAKTFLLNVKHEPDPEVQFENYFDQAIQRYDYIIYLYGTSAYNDYIGRVGAGKITSRVLNPLVDAFSNHNSIQIALVVIFSSVSLTAIGGYFLLRRKKVK